MKRGWMLPIAFACFFLYSSVSSQAQQNSVLTLTDAKQVISSSLVQAGGSAPATIDASGSIDIESGGRKEHGTIHIACRGADETFEEIKSQFTNTALVFSKGTAFDRSIGKEHSLQLAASEQSAIIPLPLLAALDSDAETTGMVVGHENIAGSDTVHIQVWKSFSSQPRLKNLQPFSKKDVWIDATTGLVKRVSFDRREGSGAVPAVRIDFYYSDFRNTQGFTVPFHVEKFVNGTHWGTINLDTVIINGPISSDEFVVPSPQGAGN
jgi:hypothetical protein